MDNLIVAIIVIVVIIVVLKGILGFFLPIITTAFPAFLGAPLSTFLGQFYIRVRRLNALKEPSTFSALMTAYVDPSQNKLIWSPRDSAIDEYVSDSSWLSIFLGLIAGSLSTIMIINMLERGGYFRGTIFFNSQIMPQTEITWAYIMCSVFIFITTAYFGRKEKMAKLVGKRINDIASKVNLEFKSIDDLQALETSIKSIASQFPMNYPAGYQTEIQQFVDTHKSEILFNTEILNKLIERNIQQAREDKRKLNDALAKYMVLKQEYGKSRSIVIKSGYNILLDELEYDFQLLNSENLMSLLIDKKWKDFEIMVNELGDEFRRLNALAEKYQTEGYDEESHKEEESSDYMNEAKALGILELEAGCSSEEIKKAYRSAARKYNVDHRQNLEAHILQLVEDKFKDINRAYQYLLKGKI